MISRLLPLILSLFLLAPGGAAAHEVCKEEAQETLELSVQELVRHETKRSFSIVPATDCQPRPFGRLPNIHLTASTPPTPDDLIIRIRRLLI